MSGFQIVDQILKRESSGEYRDSAEDVRVRMNGEFASL